MYILENPIVSRNVWNALKARFQQEYAKKKFRKSGSSPSKEKPWEFYESMRFTEMAKEDSNL